jgi:BirA family biotin operon repressor/biotin-[acetyl-CoA-carboxylase] ligase
VAVFIAFRALNQRVVRSADRLLQRLADGRFCSGEQLAGELGLTRSAVWKQVRRLQSELGLTVHAVRGRGYRLAAPLELLDTDAIRDGLTADSRLLLERLQVLTVTDSTNAQARGDLPVRPGIARVWLAEHQTAGRGRRGRPWVSVFGQNLYLSLAWRFDLAMTELAGLSLAAGVVLAELLAEFGCSSHSLKWPNDILIDQKKLAGILVEVSGEADGPATAVVGIGLNLRLPASSADLIDQPWTDLASSGLAVSRNDLAAKLVERMLLACQQYQSQRLAPFLPRWNRFDGMLNQPVNLIRRGSTERGIYRGVSAGGGMLLETPQGCAEHRAGEVSLRRLSEAQ